MGGDGQEAGVGVAPALEGVSNAEGVQKNGLLWLQRSQFVDLHTASAEFGHRLQGGCSVFCNSETAVCLGWMLSMRLTLARIFLLTEPL